MLPISLQRPLADILKTSWVFVIGGGLKLNTPMIGPGDYLQAQINYTQGALRYIFQTPNMNWGKVDGNSAGFAALTDAVHGGTLAGTGATSATSLELTTAWNINAAYEHFWNPQWRTSLYGGYAAVSNSDRANSLLCIHSTAVVASGCDMDWSTWWLGSRTQWNVTKDFYLGLDVMYAKLFSADFGGGTALTPAVNGFTNSLPKSDVDNWQFRFRVHRDFYP